MNGALLALGSLATLAVAGAASRRAGSRDTRDIPAEVMRTFWAEAEKTGVHVQVSDVSWYLDDGYALYLDEIIVPQKRQRQGLGQAAMERILRWADAHAVAITLTPSSDLGGDLDRLLNWYRALGFGRNGSGAPGTMRYAPKRGSRATRTELDRYTALYISFQAMSKRASEGLKFGLDMDDLMEHKETKAWIANTGLPLIGDGFFRLVFDLGDDRVLKVEKLMGGSSSSSSKEAARWRDATPRQRAWLVPVLDVDPRGCWIVMSKVTPYPEHPRSVRIPKEVEQVAKQLGLDLDEVRPSNLDATFRLLDYGT